jgi:quercetin dioxygenase-like cupin family protein
MTDDSNDPIEFDEVTLLALARAADAGEVPSEHVKQHLMERIYSTAADPLPAGFSILASTDGWLPHPVPGIRMKVLSIDRRRNCATLLLDVEPGSRFPPHHHGSAEECYVISGSLHACGRRLVAGDFIHADAETDHDELWTEDGCRVLLVVQPEDYFPEPIR